MTKQNAKVENDSLIKNGKVLVSIGDEFIQKKNKFRSYKCVSIDLHFIRFEKITVGGFEKPELGKLQEYQTSHFIENKLDLVKK